MRKVMKMSLPVAIQLFSLDNELEKDCRGTLKALRDMGYDGVEVCGTTYDMSYDEFNEYCKSIGLEVVSAHYSIDTMSSRPDEIYGEFSKMGTKYIAVPYLVRDQLPGGERYGETLEKFLEAGKKAHEYGMQLLYHNHNQEFEKLGDKYLLDIFLEDAGAYLLGAEYDVCWIKFSGEDPADYIERNAQRCRVVHLKDYYIQRGIKAERPEFRPVGYGCQDVPSIIDSAKKVGAEWLIVEQDKPSLDKSPLECAEMSIKYLKIVNK